MSSGPPDDRLDSWKGIATYLGRGVRTVQRWEELMWRFQQPLPWSRPGQKWVPADKIYDLADQPDGA